jgi:group I intron endonuclease
MPYVYKITNKENGKSYVGYTKRENVDHRIREHFSPSVYKNNDKPLYNAIKKYGKDSFSLEILFEGVDEEQALCKEIEYIKIYGDYNLHEGGNVPPNQKGNHWTLSEETKLKMSKPKAPRSQEHKRKLSESLMGNTPWNKGKKGVQVSWNKGTRNSPMTSKWKITKRNEEFIIENLVLWCDENNYNKNTVKYHFYKNSWPYKDIEKIEKLKCKKLE